MGCCASGGGGDDDDDDDDDINSVKVKQRFFVSNSVCEGLGATEINQAEMGGGGGQEKKKVQKD
jgi:hypothetical protein